MVRALPAGAGLFFAFLFSPFSSVSSVRTFVVAPNGSDEHPGTVDRPWRTLHKAAREAGPGDTVLVREGAYTPPVTLRRSGSQNRPLAFRNFPGETPVLTGKGATRFGIVLDGVRFVRVQGFEIREIRTPHPRSKEILHEQGAILLRESSDCVIERNRIASGGLPGYTGENPGATGIPDLHPGAWCDCGMVAIEADLRDYAAMYLVNPATGSSGRWFESRLSPQLDNTDLCVTGSLPRHSAWRLLLVAPDPGRFIESTTLTSLNPPSAIADTSWIGSGRASWNWWSGSIGPDGTPSYTTETMKYYVDFAAQSGFEYMLIDAGWAARDDITTMNGRVNVPEVVQYGASKGVQVWIWIHYRNTTRQMDEAFPLFCAALRTRRLEKQPNLPPFQSLSFGHLVFPSIYRSRKLSTAPT